MPSYYPLGDDTAPMSCEVFREAPMPTDAEGIQRRHELRQAIFEVVFGTDKERAAGIRFPFREMAPEDVAAMPPDLRQVYERDLAVARDPRSGPRVIPYSPVD